MFSSTDIIRCSVVLAESHRIGSLHNDFKWKDVEEFGCPAACCMFCAAVLNSSLYSISRGIFVRVSVGRRRGLPSVLLA